MEIEGKGEIEVETMAGTQILKDVLYVPKITLNLVSVGQLLESGYSLSFKRGLCKIKDSQGTLLLSVKMMNRSFNLDWNDSYMSVNMCVNAESSLWHKRMGHFNQIALKKMADLQMVLGLPVIKDNEDVCEACQLGKQTKLSFPSNTYRASMKLQLVHTDVCGPMQNESVNGSKYFLLFIDDYSRFCWVYFLKTKGDVFDEFVRFKAATERETRCNLKALRSDNGGEFTSRKFEDFLAKEGIKHQQTVPYTPQQNGVSERRNRTLMEMARCLLYEKSMPLKFWAEAVNTAAYLLNRMATKILVEKTPYELWYGFKPNISHLRIFGSPCYVLKPENRRRKLDQKIDVGIFIGYSTKSKAYKVYDLKTNRVVIARDVKVAENSKWNWEIAEIEGATLEYQPETDAARDDDELIDDIPVRGTRLLTDVYSRCNVAETEPIDFEEAINSQVWIAAMQEELMMIEKNETWLLVDRPSHKKVIGVKWIFKTKLNADGSINKHKARLVAKGYSQEPGTDFTDTFAPVSRLDTIKLVLAVAAQCGWLIYQLDVKSAFLNGVLKEEIYVEQPDGFEKEINANKVYVLKKALYGLKQAPRAWYSRLDEYLLSMGFERSINEVTLYVKNTNKHILIISVYVDDLLIAGNKEELVTEFKNNMKEMFEMNELGLLTYFLGMEINQFKQGYFLCQKSFIIKLLNKFAMEKCNSVSTLMILGQKLTKEDESPRTDGRIYRSLIGSLLYLTATRPDIVFAVNYLSRFMQNPSQFHFAAAKRVLRYLKGTLEYGIHFERSSSLKLTGFTDSDWGGSDEGMMSTSGYCFSMGGSIFCWNSKKQSVVAHSTAEAEYIAAYVAAKQLVWLRKILCDLGINQQDPTELMCDNTSAIAISKNSVFHDRTKHMKIKFHAIRQFQQEGELEMKFCTSKEQLADLFTKPLAKERFEDLREKLGMHSLGTKGEC